MATKKEIELILQAKLDASGGVLNDAEKLGKDIADKLEQAFEHLGDRVADILANSITRAMSNVQMPGMGGGGISMGSTAAPFAQFSIPDYAPGQGAFPGLNPLFDRPAYSTNFRMGNAGGVRSRQGMAVAPEIDPQLSLLDTDPGNTGPMAPPQASQGTAKGAPPNPIGSSSHGTDGDARARVARILGQGATGAATLLANNLFPGAKGFGADANSAISANLFDQALDADQTMAGVSSYQRALKYRPNAKKSDFGDLSDSKLKESADFYGQIGDASTAKFSELTQAIRTLAETFDETNRELRSEKSKGASADPTKINALELQLQRSGRELDIAQTQRSTVLDTVHDTYEKRDQAMSMMSKPWYKEGSNLQGIAYGIDAVSQAGRLAFDMPYLRGENRAAAAQTSTMQSRAFMGGDLQQLYAIQAAGGMDKLKGDAGMAAAGGIGMDFLAAGGAGVASYASGGLGAWLFGGAAIDRGISGVRGISNFESTRKQYIDRAIGASGAENQQEMELKFGAVGNMVGGWRASRELGTNAYSDYFAMKDDRYLRPLAGMGLTPDEQRSNRSTLAQTVGGVYGGENYLNNDLLRMHEYDIGRIQSGYGYNNMARTAAAFAYGETRNDSDTAMTRIDRGLGRGTGFVRDLVGYNTGNVGGGADETGIMRVADWSAGMAGSDPRMGRLAEVYGRNLGAYVSDNKMNLGETNSAIDTQNKIREAQLSPNDLNQLSRMDAIGALEKRSKRKLSWDERFTLLKKEADPEYMQKHFGGDGEEQVREFQRDNNRSLLTRSQQFVGSKVPASMQVASGTTASGVEAAQKQLESNAVGKYAQGGGRDKAPELPSNTDPTKGNAGAAAAAGEAVPAADRITEGFKALGVALKDLVTIVETEEKNLETASKKMKSLKRHDWDKSQAEQKSQRDYMRAMSAMDGGYDPGLEENPSDAKAPE